MDIDVQVYPHTLALAHAFAEATATALREALDGEPRATLCLTGGSTPEPAYKLLADADLPWDRIHVFWTDERMVPPDHEQSNYAMAKRALLDPAGIPESNIHRMDGTLHPKEAAEDYESVLHQFFGEDPVAFDVLHLGMGSDAHVASLFPGGPELEEYDRWTVPSRAPAGTEIRPRLSLSFLALNTARLALVIAAGEKKGEAFAEVVEAYESETIAPPPIVRVRPAGDLVWMIDRALADAAS
ncbi:6-phosphogluconolactonase [Rubricoccus marinus]|uniref:6-phosphogluconolactonase n=1 Tax=Rubricoccus marinus TaxID=716817 RepID=A0A259TX73_9BACT|nr:6-phosphogluconolactonase [Rubricoccus marinus]OZC02296.1 6-phosphogluconolactonase [Rubricoccus marinus]